MSAPRIANVEAEAALLGAMMMHGPLIDQAAERVSAEHFAEPLHGRIFAAILAQHSAGKAANPVTLIPAFEKDEAINEVGGTGYLAQLTGSGAAIVGAMDFADQVRELAQRRSIANRARQVVEAAEDGAVELSAVVELLDGAAAEAGHNEAATGEYSAAEALQLVIDGLNVPVTGARCGVIPSMDALLGPMRPTQLVIGAGRPGMGKTAVAVSYGLGAAERGHGVLMFSLEMGAEQLGERMAASLASVPHEAIRDRTMSREQSREVCRAFDRIAKLPFQIIDKSGVTLAQVRRMVRRWKRRFEARGQKLELVIIDYLQLMGGSLKNGRYELVSEISRGLKDLAKDEGVCVFALSQLSREVEKRPDKRPNLSDLRESGQIEQDADAVIFFLRLEYYLQQSEPPVGHPEREKWEADLAACRGDIEMICAKRRNGRTGTRMAKFHGEIQRVSG